MDWCSENEQGERSRIEETNKEMKTRGLGGVYHCVGDGGGWRVLLIVKKTEFRCWRRCVLKISGLGLSVRSSPQMPTSFKDDILWESWSQFSYKSTLRNTHHVWLCDMKCWCCKLCQVLQCNKAMAQLSSSQHCMKSPIILIPAGCDEILVCGLISAWNSLTKFFLAIPFETHPKEKALA